MLGPDLIDLTLSLDTSIYASGDVLADTQELANAVPTLGGHAEIRSIIANDKDDQGQAMDIVFLRSNVSIGTENAAVSVSDTNADEILGVISIASGDWVDLGGCRVATKGNLGFVVTAAAASQSIYVAAISRGTGTYTASGVTLHIGMASSEL